MPRVSLTKRLLRRLTFGDVKLISNYFGLQPRKSKEELIGQIMPQVGTSLQNLVSNKGPFSLAQWNETVVKIGGSPRRSFKAVAEEIEASLDRVFDELDGDTSITELRSDKAAVRILARKLGIDLEELEILIGDTNGNMLLSTFVTGVRATQNKPPRGEPRTPESMRIASTRVTANSIEKLSQSWMMGHLAGAEQIAIAAGFYDFEFIHTLLHKHPTVQGIRLLFNGLGGRRLDAQRDELQELARQLRKGHRTVDVRLAFAPGLFHSKLFLVTEGGVTRALVGSANATCAAFARNEEILVALADAGALTGYFDAAWRDARELSDLETKAKSLIAFFRTGILYFKPVATLTTSLNPFRELLKLMTEGERARLGGIPLPYADQEAGIGSFNLKLVVSGNSNGDGLDESAEEIGIADAKTRTRASIVPWSIETCFGYWVPSKLDNEWQEHLAIAGAKKRDRWVSLRNQLAALPEEVLCQKYREYLAGARAALEVIPALPEYVKKLRQNPFDELVFSRFFSRVMLYLQDDVRIKRLALPFISGAIPEIWDDASAYEDFQTSFFEYLDQVAQSGKRAIPAVPKSILSSINVDESVGAEQLLAFFEDYLQEHSWTDDDWIRKN